MLKNVFISNDNNGIQPSGAKYLASALTVNSSLTYLDMEISFKKQINSFNTVKYMFDNWVGDEGTAFFESMLKVNSSLTSLCLGFRLMSHFISVVCSFCERNF